ncbi:MAG: InlB B-repeat-containing protein [Clostridiales Family XIII bacterium]|nr:InlB B-repeat-containing protein [Clostridiales Family XIII bacterium]
MKKSFRFLSVLLTVVMVITLIPASAITSFANSDDPEVIDLNTAYTALLATGYTDTGGRIDAVIDKYAHKALTPDDKTSIAALKQAIVDATGAQIAADRRAEIEALLTTYDLGALETAKNTALAEKTEADIANGAAQLGVAGANATLGELDGLAQTLANANAAVTAAQTAVNAAQAEVDRISSGKSNAWKLTQGLNPNSEYSKALQALGVEGGKLVAAQTQQGIAQAALDNEAAIRQGAQDILDAAKEAAKTAAEKGTAYTAAVGAYDKAVAERPGLESELASLPAQSALDQIFNDLLDTVATLEAAFGKLSLAVAESTGITAVNLFIGSAPQTFTFELLQGSASYTGADAPFTWAVSGDTNGKLTIADVGSGSFDIGAAVGTTAADGPVTLTVTATPGEIVSGSEYTSIVVLPLTFTVNLVDELAFLDDAVTDVLIDITTQADGGYGDATVSRGQAGGGVAPLIYDYAWGTNTDARITGNPDGTITVGKDANAGTYTVTVTVTDSAIPANSIFKTFDIVVTNAYDDRYASQLADLQSIKRDIETLKALGTQLGVDFSGILAAIPSDVTAEYEAIWNNGDPTFAGAAISKQEAFEGVLSGGSTLTKTLQDFIDEALAGLPSWVPQQIKDLAIAGAKLAFEEAQKLAGGTVGLAPLQNYYNFITGLYATIEAQIKPVVDLAYAAQALSDFTANYDYASITNLYYADAYIQELNKLYAAFDDALIAFDASDSLIADLFTETAIKAINEFAPTLLSGGISGAGSLLRAQLENIQDATLRALIGRLLEEATSEISDAASGLELNATFDDVLAVSAAIRDALNKLADASACLIRTIDEINGVVNEIKDIDPDAVKQQLRDYYDDLLDYVDRYVEENKQALIDQIEEAYKEAIKRIEAAVTSEEFQKAVADAQDQLFDFWTDAVTWSKNTYAAIDAAIRSIPNPVIRPTHSDPLRVDNSYTVGFTTNYDNFIKALLAKIMRYLNIDIKLFAYASDSLPEGFMLSKDGSLTVPDPAALTVPNNRFDVPSDFFPGYVETYDTYPINLKLKTGIPELDRLLAQFGIQQIVSSTIDVSVFIGTSPIPYGILYDLDGGVNAAANPVGYTVEDVITIDGATKSGYIFQGWYDSAFFSGTPITGWNAGTLRGDVTLFAKWTAVVVNNDHQDIVNNNQSGVNPAVVAALNNAWRQITLPSPDDGSVAVIGGSAVPTTSGGSNVGGADQKNIAAGGFPLYPGEEDTHIWPWILLLAAAIIVTWIIFLIAKKKKKDEETEEI